jgi:histidinol-phosphate/aromatic aminotransferase/cobyric acid decarboxylase-like protein/adenosyl cobinamide kinase/adenosyl cobinamide phosphate guanylyltransferase
MTLVLVTGGTSSGKSEVAERLVADTGAPVTYIATAQPTDAEMAERIASHRMRRPKSWTTISTIDPHSALQAADKAHAVLIDALGPWLAHLMQEYGLFTDEAVAELGAHGRRSQQQLLYRLDELAQLAVDHHQLCVVVSEQTGLGPVPSHASTRRFCDLSGKASQRLAEKAQRVVLVTAGCELELKNSNAQTTTTHVARRHGDTVVPAGCEDFAVNVEQDPDQPWLESALSAALARRASYPDESGAIEAIARKHRRSPAEVVPTNGASEAIWLLALAQNPRQAVCIHPTFTEHERALGALGHPVTRVFRHSCDFSLPSDAIPDSADLVVTVNPNNPTGTLDSAETIRSLARPGRLLVVDEAFMDFVADEKQSLSADNSHQIVVIRSLTKVFSLAGIRAGYLLAPKPLAQRLRSLRPMWSVNNLALAAIEACLARPDAVKDVVERVVYRRRALQDALGRLEGIQTWPSAANFVLARTHGRSNAYSQLLDHRIAVRPAGDFPGLSDEYIRVAVRSDAQNQRLLHALSELCG